MEDKVCFVLKESGQIEIINIRDGFKYFLPCAMLLMLTVNCGLFYPLLNPHGMLLPVILHEHVMTNISAHKSVGDVVIIS